MTLTEENFLPPLPPGCRADRRLPSSPFELQTLVEHIEAVFPQLPLTSVVFNREQDSRWNPRSSSKSDLINELVDHNSVALASQKVALQFAMEETANGSNIFHELRSLGYAKLIGTPNPSDTAHTKAVSGIAVQVPWIHTLVVLTLWEFYVSSPRTVRLPHAKVAELPGLMRAVICNFTNIAHEALGEIVQRTIKNDPASVGMLVAYQTASEWVASKSIFARPRPTPITATDKVTRSAASAAPPTWAPTPAPAAAPWSPPAKTSDTKPRNPCKNWNRGFKCKDGKNCTWAHVCDRCGIPGHPAKSCKK